MNESMIAALKRERAGYVARGLKDRVRQVDEQLERYGVVVDVAPPAQVDAGPLRAEASGKLRKAVRDGE